MTSFLFKDYVEPMEEPDIETLYQPDPYHPPGMSKYCLRLERDELPACQSNVQYYFDSLPARTELQVGTLLGWSAKTLSNYMSQLDDTVLPNKRNTPADTNIDTCPLRDADDEVKRLIYSPALISDSEFEEQNVQQLQASKALNDRKNRSMHEYYYRNAIIKKLQADSHPVNRTENDMAYKIEHSKYDHIALRYQTTNPDAATLPINVKPVKNLNLTEYMREEPNPSHSPIVTEVVLNYEVSTSPPERFPSIKAHEDWWDQMSIEWREPQPIVIRDIAAGYQETHNENYKHTVDSTQLVTDVGFETCSKLWNPALRQDTAPWRQGDYMQALQTSVGHTSTPPMSPGLMTIIESPEALNLALQWLDKTNADTFTQYQYVITP
ncbi:MAG: hypothetical protein GY737_02230, partial [Desulfobacteraceae bacterium]|nr:hypothetical protein [Desulfobacteraceae bacterium]